MLGVPFYGHVGARTLAKNYGGVMIWELGHDAPAGANSLFSAIQKTR